MDGVRLIIRPGPGDRAVAVDKAGAVKNVLDGYLSRCGVKLDRRRPSPYGFGVLAKPLRSQGPHRLYRIREIRVGSTSEAVVRALRVLNPQELYEPTAVPGTGLDLRNSSVGVQEEYPLGSLETVAGYAVSPIRVLDTRPGQPKGHALRTFGPEFDVALNRTMAWRFGRPFHLQFLPDLAYVRLHRGEVVARLGVKGPTTGKVVALDGVVLPFVLVGPPEDLREAWFNGLGGATGQGFGWWEAARA